MQGQGKLCDGDEFIYDVRYDIGARVIQRARDTERMSVTGVLSRLPALMVVQINPSRSTYVL